MISSEVTASLNFAFVDDDFDDGSDFRGCWGIVELLVEEEEDPLKEWYDNSLYNKLLKETIRRKK